MTAPSDAAVLRAVSPSISDCARFGWAHGDTIDPDTTRHLTPESDVASGGAETAVSDDDEAMLYSAAQCPADVGREEQ
ncbi:hypothetical protein G6O67_000764 [Ophiocordyceps sinensis]|uniref:Uncharacterized protein n=1 Tax=Ophiocordyceps sinensis TaxID=72228 RepID=A0A8H4VA39_9HYPO|nr:hypothetical protein G6O67_000764 [Ophiocordyceps sinensis]